MLFILSFFLFYPSPTNALILSDTVKTIQVDRDPLEGDQPVTQSYIFIEIENPIGTIILFAGGKGRLFLEDWQLHIRSTNFLVRTRHHFAAEGFNVVVMDAASDFLNRPSGAGLIGYRTSSEHLTDIATVINALPNVGPICLIGTSRGTISAAAYAAESSLNSSMPYIDYLVLTSSLTQQGNNLDAQNIFDDVSLESIQKPTCLVAHENEGCFVTPVSDIDELKERIGFPKVKIKTFTGGTTDLSGPCDPLSAHGFFGIEQEVISEIGVWIREQLYE